MANRPKSAPPFPSREEIVEFIRLSEKAVGKREIARAFHLTADQKVELREVLKGMEADGALARARGRRFGQPGKLPSVSVIEVTGTDTDGETVAKPAVWRGDGPAPIIYVAPEKRGRGAFGPGERALARLTPIGPSTFEARVIRRLTAAPPRMLGVLTMVGGQARLTSVDKRSRDEVIIAPDGLLGAEAGELVWAEVRSARPLGLKSGRIVERIGPVAGPKSISLITIHDHDIPTKFSDDALAEAAAAGPALVADREDLRSVPLVTIDGADARDFDDAVFAARDDDPANPGGWRLLVAIADVAWYVRPGSALDRAAYDRGNSVYFPDCVVPMLPFELSNGWCSLKPGEDRPCLTAELWIDADGALRRHRFLRGMMRSAARLTYGQAQAAREGRPDDTTAPLLETVIAPLFDAYAVLAKARVQRGVLELDVPERRVVIAASGFVEKIEVRERLDSHKLIEEFMILANVAAAEALEAKHRAALYRVHDQPSAEKLESLREFLETLDLRLRPGRNVKPADFNGILGKVAGKAESRLVNEVVLRSQAQAIYHPENIGHFGLALRRYCHFTSPIRRYADLVVHRGLIDAFGLGRGGQGGEAADLGRTGEHVSATERRAAAAERDAVDRFAAAFLAEKVGSEFGGRITGVTRFGLFVTLDGSGADGLVPISTLPSDYYRHDEAAHQLVGEHSRLTFRLGDAVNVRLREANPLTGGIALEILSGVPEGARRSRPPAGRSRPRAPRARPFGRKRR